MTVNVGVIGAGMIGQDHIRRLTHVLSGASVVAVADVDQERAKAVAATYGIAVTHGHGRELILDKNIDAILVASWGATHEEFVLASIAAGKPTFCEKPLATTPEGCWRIVEAEIGCGRRYVQVGFMRRYDAGYRALKQAAHNGSIGTPLLMHCAHRNPAVPDSVTSDMVLTDSIVHEIDLVRWMFDTEIKTVTVLSGKRSANAAAALQDPMMVIFEMESGVLVDVELNVNVRYGYDIRGEVVGETGAAHLPIVSDILVVNEHGQSARVPVDWRERFSHAYDKELQEWIDSIREGREASGPSAWDGYAATAATDSCVKSFQAAATTRLTLRPRPNFYAP